MVTCDYELFYDEDKHRTVTCDGEAVYAVHYGTDSIPEDHLCELHKPRIVKL